jgi:hypothetical protein
VRSAKRRRVVVVGAGAPSGGRPAALPEVVLQGTEPPVLPPTSADLSQEEEAAAEQQEQEQEEHLVRRRCHKEKPSPPGMTAERMAKLKALGVSIAREGSNSRPGETKWEAQLVRLAAYKAAHGDCNVPKGQRTEDRPLARWTNTQRRLKRKLDRGEPCEGMTAARVAKLEALGFAWEGFNSRPHAAVKRGETKWAAQLVRLASYKAAHGNCNVWKSWAEDPLLARWVQGQRELKKKLDRGMPCGGMTAVRVAKLDALGFAWESSQSRQNEAAWEERLVRLVAYNAAHGNCNVRKDWAEDPLLAHWVKRQRAYKKKLDRGMPCKGMTAARVAKLDALGFAWDLHGNVMWEAQLARLAAYKVANGDCNVPRGWAEDTRLAGWVDSQRIHKRKLDRGEPCKGMTAARVAKLAALGFAWEGSKLDNAQWKAQLARLAVYKAEHGDCNVPKGWAKDPRLGAWVTMQRYKKRKLDRGEPGLRLTAERVAELEGLDFEWDVGSKTAAWEAQLARLVAHKAAHGDCSVPHRWVEDPRLGFWVQKQRAGKKALERGGPSEGMTAARAAKLTALGFAWDPSAHVVWEAQFARLVAYKAAHGDCNVPRGWAEVPELANWVHTQRTQKKRLGRSECSHVTAERTARLMALGFVWDLTSKHRPDTAAS